MNTRDVLKRPSGFVPLLLSGGALLTVLVQVAAVGVVRQADEGAAAHVFQLLMAAQLPVLLWFAVRWLPRAPGPSAAVLALQAGAALAALAPVYFLGL